MNKNIFSMEKIADSMEDLDNERVDQQKPLQYLQSQSKLYPLMKAKNALIAEWNNAMNEFAICRSKPRTSGPLVTPPL
jgi:hypothetical protein